VAPVRFVAAVVKSTRLILGDESPTAFCSVDNICCDVVVEECRIADEDDDDDDDNDDVPVEPFIDPT